VERETSVQTVISADGTAIAIERHAADPTRPPLVFVLGAFCDRRSDAPLRAGLGDRFTIWQIDRRGRGDSGDTPPWAIEREVQDIAAVLAAIGELPFVYGHSSGAALALEAAAAGVPMRGIVVYEPPYTETEGATTRRADELQALCEDGRPEDAALLFLRGTGVPPEQLERMRQAAWWPHMVALAPTLHYDVRLADGGAVPVQRFAGIRAPLLALFGGASPEWAPRAAHTIAAAVPGARAHGLEGQTHGVTPQALAPVLTEFFS
jgi:pimeloyl-ACP methyl ester carboxylesterase